MSDTSFLIVPMQVWGMVLNGRPQTMRRWSMNYYNLDRFQSPVPEPFHNDIPDDYAVQDKNKGVYLMWNLPESLRHGVKRGNQIEFPPVPNRWLIVRYSGPAAAREAQAWVVDSDQIHPDPGDGSPHDMGSPYLEPGRFSQTVIGQNRKLADWSEPGKSPVQLTAVAPGNLMFSAFQSANNNVFSFHDNLVTQHIDESTLSYMVVGWYADPSSDPLAQSSDVSAILNELNWTVDGPLPASARCLFHGMIQDLSWKEGTEAIPSARDTVPDQVNVAVGSTGIQALTALLTAQLGENHNPIAASLLAAFQYGMLDLLEQPGGQELFAERLREKSYGFSSSGLAWEIVNEGENGLPTEDTTPSAEQLAQEASWLKPLNELQALINQKTGELLGLQRNLYELWWKKGYAAAYYKTSLKYPFGTNKQQFDAAFDISSPTSLVSQVYAKWKELTVLLDQAPHPDGTTSLEEAADLYAARHNLMKGRRLKAKALERYWEAGDPVLLVSGVNHPRTLEAEGSIACRWAGQIMTGIRFDQREIRVADLGERFLLPAGWERIPLASGAFTALAGECFITDPFHAGLIAEAALKDTSDATASRLKNEMGIHAVPLTDEKLPYFGLEPWEQPWIPLYLEWQAVWYPIPYEMDGKTVWTLGEQEFDLNRNVAQPPAQTLTGRSLLTPQTQQIFKKQLALFLKQHPDQTLLKQLDDFIEQTNHWDFLSQAMEGISTQLAMRNPGPQPLFNAASFLGQNSAYAGTDWIGEGHFFAPKSIEATPADPWHIGDSVFEGLRSGQFVFERISIVDRFGQIIEVINSQTQQSFDRLYIEDSLKPTRPIPQIQSARAVQLPPRLLQEGRLNFGFLGGDDPVLAWLVPNHLDQALAIYSKEGAYLGEVNTAVLANGGLAVQWAREPRSGPTLENLLTQSPELGSLLQQLVRQSPDTFLEYITVIDETLWTVEPDTESKDDIVSLLAGRPLALVKASLQYEIRGEPIRDPRWPDTFKPPVDPLFIRNKYSFPVRLGNRNHRYDGLIGYYLEDDYSMFNTVHSTSEPSAAEAYIRPIGDGNLVPLSFIPGQTSTVTMLMDPRCSVHAYTGLFPAVRVTLPPERAEEALNNMLISIHAGPLLTLTQAIVDEHDPSIIEERLLLPIPGGTNKEWTWQQLTDAAWTQMRLSAENQTARLGNERPVLREGDLLMKYSQNPLHTQKKA